MRIKNIFNSKSHFNEIRKNYTNIEFSYAFKMCATRSTIDGIKVQIYETYQRLFCNALFGIAAGLICYLGVTLFFLELYHQFMELLINIE